MPVDKFGRNGDRTTTVIKNYVDTHAFTTAGGVVSGDINIWF